MQINALKNRLLNFWNTTSMVWVGVGGGGYGWRLGGDGDYYGRPKPSKFSEWLLWETETINIQWQTTMGDWNHQSSVSDYCGRLQPSKFSEWLLWETEAIKVQWQWLLWETEAIKFQWLLWETEVIKVQWWWLLWETESIKVQWQTTVGDWSHQSSVTDYCERLKPSKFSDWLLWETESIKVQWLTTVTMGYH